MTPTERDAAYPPDQNYGELYRVLLMAYDRAANGKGRERHASGEEFQAQPICVEARLLGTPALIYQIRKKALETLRLKPEAAIKEYLDVIVHAAAAVLVLEERREG